MLRSGALVDRVALQLVITALELTVRPGLTLIFCLCLALDPLSTVMAVLFHGAANGCQSYVTARVMGGDAPLMAAITSAQHFSAVLSLPVSLLLLKHMTGHE